MSDTPVHPDPHVVESLDLLHQLFLAVNMADNALPGFAETGRGLYEHIEAAIRGAAKLAAPDLDPETVAWAHIDSGESLPYVIAYLRKERVDNIATFEGFERDGWPEWLTAEEVRVKRNELHRMRERIALIPA
jgi:nicotinamide riboside kinase